jgi:hypothetical protein
MHRSGTQHALLVGVVLAFCVLAAAACGAPEVAKPRPLPDGPRKLEPGAYRTEQFEPAFSFRVGEGWSNAQPEAYDLLVITRGDEGGVLGFTNLKGARFFEPTRTGTAYMTDVPKDVVGWFQEHPYLETQGTDPVEVGGIEGVRLDFVVGDLPEGHHSEWCGSGCVNLIRFGSGSPPLILRQEDKARLIVLEDVEGETVVTGFAIRAAEFDDHAPEAQKVLDTVEWRSG